MDQGQRDDPSFGTKVRAASKSQVVGVVLIVDGDGKKVERCAFHFWGHLGGKEVWRLGVASAAQ